MKNIKSIIGLVLLVVWFMAFILLIGEPSIDEGPATMPDWVGYAYIAVLIGLPFIALNLIMSDIDKIKK